MTTALETPAALRTILDSTQESIYSSWRQTQRVTQSSDLLAIVEDGRPMTILCGVRSLMLRVLADKGVDLEHQSLCMLKSPAEPPTAGLMCIWVVVLENDKAHVAKMVNPISSGGQS
jgi:hypothetical protein